MNRKRLSSSAVGFALAGVLFLAAGCERRSALGPRVEAAPPGPAGEEKPSPSAKGKAEPDAPAKAAPPAAKEAIEALGAAAWLPENPAFFSASFRLLERVEALARSRAVSKLAALPLVQLFLAQARSHPAYAQLLTGMRENPLIGDGVKLAGEAISSEVFIWGGEAWVPFQLAVQGIYLDVAILGFQSALQVREPPDREVTNTMVRSALAREKDLRCPPIILGFRLAAPDGARAYLERVVKEVEGQVPITKEKLGGGEHHVLRLSGKKLRPETRELISARLRSTEVLEERIEKFLAYVDSLTLAVTAGLRGDYLLLTLGSDTRHLERLGEGPSLAGSKAFAPVLARMKKGLLSLGYVHPQLNLLQKLDAGATVTNLREVFDALPKEKVPDGLPARIEKDARALIDDLNRFLPDAAPLVTASFIERGIESFAFVARGTSLLETGKPLAITDRAGPAPHGAFAERRRPALEDYRVAARWARTAYSYFEDYAVPRIPEGKRKDFESFRKLFLPAIRELHEITETLFLPSIDGGEEMLVLDAEGTLSIWPADGRRLERPIRFPRPAIVLEVKDPEKLRGAFSRYRESLNRFFAKASADLGAKRIEIPEPATRPHAGGTLYTYEMPPTPLGPDLEPHAVLAESWLVLSLFPAQSKAMLESKWEPPEAAVALKAPAGRVVRADLERWTRILIENGSILAAELAKDGRFPPDQLPTIQLHLKGVGDALKALRTYSSRTHDEGALEVHHSWLEIRDLEDAQLLVLCLSLLPVALCAAIGCRAGLRRILGKSALVIACYSAFVLTLAAAFRAGWFEPLGLATPLLLGLAAAAAVRLLWPFPRTAARKLSAAEGARGLSRGERAAGALAGALGGSVAALVLWLLLLAVSPFAFPSPRGRAEPEVSAGEEDLFRALIRTANHGFIRRVPLVGPMEEEVEALVSILETDHAVRAEYIRRRDWRGIENLASFREVLADEGIFEDIERVRGGDLMALYRLQKNPRILAFSTEGEVLRLVRGTRPSAIAAELEAIEREVSPKPRR